MPELWMGQWNVFQKLFPDRRGCPGVLKFCLLQGLGSTRAVGWMNKLVIIIITIWVRTFTLIKANPNSFKLFNFLSSPLNPASLKYLKFNFHHEENSSSEVATPTLSLSRGRSQSFYVDLIVSSAHHVGTVLASASDIYSK